MQFFLQNTVSICFRPLKACIFIDAIFCKSTNPELQTFPKACHPVLKMGIVLLSYQSMQFFFNSIQYMLSLLQCKNLSSQCDVGIVKRPDVERR